MIPALLKVDDVDLIERLDKVKRKMLDGDYKLYHSSPYQLVNLLPIPDGNVPDYAEVTSDVDQFDVSIEETGYITWFIRENYHRHCTVSGEFLYKPDGLQTWHTNSDLTGWRYYFIYNEGTDSKFYYRNQNGHYCTESEPEHTWVMRAFEVTEDGSNEHAVSAGGGNRISIGFREV
jgi:hypothetical protein